MDATLRDLLQQIVIAPADDTVRLVYADRLDELGEHDRAEFIRVQVEAERVRKIPGWVPSGEMIEDATHHPDRSEALMMLFRINNHDREKRFNELKCRERELLEPEGRILFEESPEDPKWKYGFRKSVWAFGYSGRFPGITPEFTRGFISSLTCTAEDFLAHADKLVWHPEMTDECPECEGTGIPHGKRARNTYVKCRACGGDTRVGRDGTGCIPRPMPDTAQPITRVKLTTLPHEREFGTIETMRNGVVRCYRYPGVEFELPSLLHTA